MDKNIKLLKSKLRRRLKAITDKAACHCSDGGEMHKMFAMEEELVELVISEIESSFGKGVDRGQYVERSRARSDGGIG